MDDYFPCMPNCPMVSEKSQALSNEDERIGTVMYAIKGR